MARHPGMLAATLREYTDDIPDRPLAQGDVLRMIDGEYHYVQYVNSSGAYAVPLSAVSREIKGREVAFTAGGRTISAYSIVQIVNPLVMGGSSPEYQRYVRMARASGLKANPGNGKVGEEMDSKGITYAEFAEGDIVDPTADLPDGQTGGVVTATAGKGNKGMAKKAAKKANGNGKAPKTVRKCVCGCGSETTGHFAPGHDARYHGWIKKLADGRMEMKELPASLKSKLDTVTTKEGVRVKNPEFYRADSK